jgi:hypothetical protein
MADPVMEPSGSSPTSQSPNGNSDGGAGGAPEPKFWEGFADEGLRGHPSVTKFATAQDMAKGLVEAEKRLGVPAEQLLKLPTKADDAEGWKEVYAKLGRPETPDGYRFELPADATDELKGIVKELGVTAHAAGLSQAQLVPVVGLLNKYVADAAEAATQAREEQTAATQATLKKEWGAKYDVYAKEIGRFLVANGGQPLVDELNAGGMGNSVGLNKLLAKMMDAMAEPGGDGGGHGREDLGGGPMTPAAARAEINKLESEEPSKTALTDKYHPQHNDVVARRTRLLQLEAGQEV